MRKIYCYNGHLGILDELNGSPKIYWINEDLSPIWSNYVHGQKSIHLDSLDADKLELIFELDFDYEHVTNIFESKSSD